jgi:hypothetical protein
MNIILINTLNYEESGDLGVILILWLVINHTGIIFKILLSSSFVFLTFKVLLFIEKAFDKMINYLDFD